MRASRSVVELCGCAAMLLLGSGIAWTREAAKVAVPPKATIAVVPTIAEQKPMEDTPGPFTMAGSDDPGDGGSRGDCDGDIIVGTQSTHMEAYPLSGILATTYARSMSLIRRSEITDCTPYEITHLAIDIQTAKTMNFNGVEIRIKKVTTTVFPANTVPWDGTGTLVWGPVDGVQMTPTGWKTFTLTTPFIWDSDNLLITWQGIGTGGGGSNYPQYWRGVDLGWRCQCFSASTNWNNNMTPFQMRARYQLTFAPTPIGACCEPGTPSCEILTLSTCTAAGGTFLGIATTCSGLDCNGNGVDDTCDLATGTSQDCNQNSTPDECDIGVQWGGYCTLPDCSSDWNYNGVPDECEPCGDLTDCSGTRGPPDGNVDICDYWAIVDAFGWCVGDPKYNPVADLDGDGCITLADYHIWRICYKMVNGVDFVGPAPRPVPDLRPVKGTTGLVE